MRRRSGILALGIAILGLGSHAAAQEMRWTHFGPRPLGMGNAFVSVVDDYNTLFYNPAGLARLKEWNGEFLNPHLEISAKTQGFIKDATELAGGANESTKATLELIEEQTGNVQHFALGLTPHLIFQNFGFGLGAQVDAMMVFHRYPSAYVKFGPEVIMPFGFATNFLENRLSVGASIKLRAKGGIDHEFSIQDIEAFRKGKGDTGNEGDDQSKDLEEYVQGGYGTGVDVGMLFTPVKTMEPTIGLSVADLGATSYKKMDIGGTSTGAPKPALPTVNAGVSLKPIQAGGMYLLTAVDVHAINHPVSFSKKLNLGVEWGYSDWIKVQTGLHQGYLTAGFQLDIMLLRLAFVTYAEELGTVAGSIEDRRYAVQLKVLI